MNTLFTLALLALFELPEAKTVVVTVTADYCPLETVTWEALPELSVTATPVETSAPVEASTPAESSAEATSALSSISINPILSISIHNDAVASATEAEDCDSCNTAVQTVLPTQSTDAADAGTVDPAATSSWNAASTVDPIQSSVQSSDVLTGPTATPLPSADTISSVSSDDSTSTTTITRTITETITTSIDYTFTLPHSSSAGDFSSGISADPTQTLSSPDLQAPVAPSAALSLAPGEALPAVSSPLVITTSSPATSSSPVTTSPVVTTSPTAPATTSSVTPLSTASSVPATTATTSAAPAPTLDAFAQNVVDYHNQVRAVHQAPPMVWNQTIADFATNYLTTVIPTCNFKHSGGPYGENIALGFPTQQAAMEAWYNEYVDYDYAAGQFGENTGHFTQMVWVASTSVGCAHSACADGRDYLVCEYWPRGNVIGWFTENVLPPVSG